MTDLPSTFPLQPDLTEARRLHAAGFSLVKLHPYTKQPIGMGWNKRQAVSIDDSATGYGMPLAANGLCSIDPDHVEMARVGLKAWGFDLDELMSQGVRTNSTRPGSGGRAALAADDMEMMRWLTFTVFDDEGNSTTVLELRAKSENLQDCVPGVVYSNKDTGELYTQQYCNGKTFDQAPPVPDAFARLWRQLSTDDDELRERTKQFVEAIIAAGFDINGKRPEYRPPMGSGERLAFPSGYRGEYNRANAVESVLYRHGYTWHAREKRYSHPGATGAPGIRPIPGKDGLWRSDHAGDPLHGTFDAWAAFVQLDHRGDQKAAENAQWDAASQELLEEFADEQGADNQPPEPAHDNSGLPDYPDELLCLPHQLGELQAFIINSMSYPSLATAGITAIATLTAFAQTILTIKSRAGLGFNEYYLVLAPTGFGKEDLRNPIERLHHDSDDLLRQKGFALADDVKLYRAASSSKQGLHQCLEHSRSVFFLSDEFAEWLRQSHNDGHKQAALGYLMEIYTKALGTVEPGHAVTQKYTPVKNPRLSILATSTAEAIFEHMTREQADSGAYNRWVIFAGESELPPKRYDGLEYTPKKELVEFIAWVKEQTSQELRFSKAGYAEYKRLDTELAEPIKRRDGILGGRLGEQAIKLAGLVALSDRRFTIEPADLQTAFNIRIGLYHRAAALTKDKGSLSGMHKTGEALEQVVGLFRKKRCLRKSELITHSRKYGKLAIHEQRAVLQQLIDEGHATQDPDKKALLHSNYFERMFKPQ